MNSKTINDRIKELKKLLKDQTLPFNNSMDWREIEAQIGSKNTNSLQSKFMRHACNEEEFEKWREKCKMKDLHRDSNDLTRESKNLTRESKKRERRKRERKKR